MHFSNLLIYINICLSITRKAQNQACVRRWFTEKKREEDTHANIKVPYRVRGIHSAQLQEHTWIFGAKFLTGVEFHVWVWVAWGGKREGGLLPKTFQIYCSKAVVHLKIRNFKRTEIDE